MGDESRMGADESDLGRRHWLLRASARGHVLDILPSTVEDRVSIRIDDMEVLAIPKPSAPRPRSEGTLSVEGTNVAVLLTWHEPVMQTDVFEGGFSLRDGRSLDDARAHATAPTDGYELWFRTGFTFTRGSLAPQGVLWLLLAGLLANAFVFVSGVAGTIAGGLVTAGGAAVLVAWVWYWLAFTVAVHRYLLRHPELGDVGRAVMLVTSFLGFPVVTIVAAVAMGLLIQVVA